MKIKTILAKAIGTTPLALFPVRVRMGPAKGAWWTLAPFSANWRKGGGENDVRIGLKRFGNCKGRVFWDMGAHFGIHTVGFAFLSGPHGQVVAFEPDPAAFRRLSRHVAMNKLNNVHLFNAAASEKEGEETLYMDGGSSNAHLKYNEWDEMPTKTRVLKIRTIAIDDMVNSKELRNPDFIKVDVQGHGGKALKGCRQAISNSLPLIVFSNHSQTEQDGVSDILRPLGYIPENLDGQQLEWGMPFDEVIFVPPKR